MRELSQLPRALPLKVIDVGKSILEGLPFLQKLVHLDFVFRFLAVSPRGRVVSFSGYRCECFLSILRAC